MSNILTFKVISKFLDVISLLIYAIIVDDYRDNTFTIKDKQDAIYSLRDKLIIKDYFNDIFIISNSYNANYSLGELIKDKSIPGY
jgi:hypothetical protein